MVRFENLISAPLVLVLVFRPWSSILFYFSTLRCSLFPWLSLCYSLRSHHRTSYLLLTDNHHRPLHDDDHHPTKYPLITIPTKLHITFFHCFHHQILSLFDFVFKNQVKRSGNEIGNNTSSH